MLKSLLPAAAALSLAALAGQAMTTAPATNAAGLAFPGSAAHAADHTAILAELEAHRSCTRGDPLRRARAFVTARLPAWCDAHFTSHDRDLAEHLKAGQRGGRQG